MLYEAITTLFPKARVDVDFRLRDDCDGNGPYIEVWDEAAIGAPMPTKAEIEAAYRSHVPAGAGDDLDRAIHENPAITGLVRLLAARWGQSIDELVTAMKSAAG